MLTNPETLQKVSLSNNPIPIALIGLMGSGKSSVAKQLADIHKRPYIDTDERIIASCKSPITEIFSKHGEAYFRRQETNILKQIEWSKNPIIATGGGIILNKENQQILQEKCTLIYLSATKETLRKRLENDTSRPLLNGADKAEKLKILFNERHHIYQALSNYTIETDGLSIKDIITTINSHI